MNVSDLEDGVFSCFEWILGHLDGPDDANIDLPEEVFVSEYESEKDRIIRQHLIGEYHDVQAKLTELKAELGANQAKLLNYVVGADAQHLLDILCAKTSVSLLFLNAEQNPGFRQGFGQDDFNVRIAECEQSLLQIDDLPVEGAGGVEQEEGLSWYYPWAYNVIHAIRALLDRVTRLCGYQRSKNTWAEAILHRPFFFQVPCSPEEKLEIIQVKDELKKIIKYVNQKQDALNRALYTQVNSHDDGDSSVHSEDTAFALA